MKNASRKTRLPIRLLALALVVFLSSQALVLPTLAATSGQTVQVTYNGQTVDSFNGVPAKYITGTGNSNSGTYSCAGYVKTYYSKIFNVSVYNLVSNATPKTSESGYSFKQITSNILPGDIVRLPGHWAIVKSVNGNTLTIIEQNWKWASGGKTYCSINRTVTVGVDSGLAVFTLYKNNTRINKNFGSANIVYQAHVQNYGTMSAVSNGATAGTTGKGLRMEDLSISLNGISGGLSYRSHVSCIGWKPWVTSGSCGTQGQSLQMEAIQIKLTGAAASKYSVTYRVHVQNIGWMNWVKDGAVAGTTGQSLRIEAIEIKLVPK